MNPYYLFLLLLPLLLIVWLILYISYCDTSDIKEVYYINLDSSTERNKNFKENYKKHSLGPNVPVIRISGVFLKEEPKELSKQNLRNIKKVVLGKNIKNVVIIKNYYTIKC